MEYLVKEKLNLLNNDVKNLKQRLDVIDKEKRRIIERIRSIENNIKRCNIDRNFIVNYNKIKKHAQ
jgi:hypothetical protein